MRKIYVHIIVVCVLLLNVVSCTSTSKELQEIDDIMETKPEVALTRLEKIVPNGLSQSDYPYYGLLYTQAQIKNGIAVTSDSLIKNAYDVYGHDSTSDLKLRAYFYNAKVYYKQIVEQQIGAERSESTVTAFVTLCFLFVWQPRNAILKTNGARVQLPNHYSRNG